MFSNLSSSSISLATVTPSCVIRGAPYDLSSTTLRPLGPSVTRTAWASVSMPRNMLSRASTENLTSLADILIVPSASNPRSYEATALRTPQAEDARRSGGLHFGDGCSEHAHNVVLFHDQELDA